MLTNEELNEVFAEIRTGETPNEVTEKAINDSFEKLNEGTNYNSFEDFKEAVERGCNDDRTETGSDDSL